MKGRGRVHPEAWKRKGLQQQIGETNQNMDWRFWPWDNWGPKHSSLSSEPFCTLPSSGTSWPSYSLSWNAYKLISVRRHVFKYLMQEQSYIQNSIQLAELIFISKNQNKLKISLILLFSYPSTSQIDFWASVHTQYVDFFFSIPQVWFAYCNLELTIHLLCCMVLQLFACRPISSY